jgi:hypothetical protein
MRHVTEDQDAERMIEYLIHIVTDRNSPRMQFSETWHRASYEMREAVRDVYECSNRLANRR